VLRFCPYCFADNKGIEVISEHDHNYQGKCMTCGLAAPKAANIKEAEKKWSDMLDAIFAWEDRDDGK